MKRYERVYEIVHLDAVRENMEAMRDNLTKGCAIIGVVKTDGYGHGAVPIACAIDPYVCGYAVATPEEALILRRHGITKSIQILGVAPEGSFEDVIRYDISPTVFSYERAEKLSKTAEKLGKTVSIHIALDTGMSRIGYAVSQEAADEVAKIDKLPAVRIEGLFTHFAKADEADKTETYRQMERYKKFVDMLEERGVFVPVKHCSNSAGILELKEANLNAVRAGISIYGLYPSDEVEKEPVKLRPVMELKSFVTYVKKIAPGTSVSYGGTFTAQRETEVATIPMGYGDGYPRNLSNKGDVLIHGKRARILGRVCMDQFMVDVTDIEDVKEGDEVTLIGRDGEEMIAVEELAERGGGFHYEILCDMGKRVPRVYMDGEDVVGSKDYFDDRYEDFRLGR